MQDGLTSPTQHEFTFSAGMQLPRGGYAKLTFINRDLKDIIDNFIEIDAGCTNITFRDFSGCLDNVEFRNTNGPTREYQAIELQGKYGLMPNWSVEGNYTHQLRNHGSYEGEGGQSIGATNFGNYPEMLVERNNPVGRLSQFQAHKVRLWTTYTLGFGRFGDLAAGLIYRYDSPQTFSFSTTANLSAIQKARDPGYQSPPRNSALFFGDRGIGEYNSSSLFDLSLTYGIPVFRRVEPWIKFDVRNVLNSDTLLTYNTAITPVGSGPMDADGLPTTFTKNATFGRPTSALSYVVPREYLIYAGIRF